MLRRRDILVTVMATLATPVFGRATRQEPSAALKALEAKAGGRLGVCFLDSRDNRIAGNRLDERFAMCSTFKLPLAAFILREADQGRLRLDELVRYSKKDMLSYAPVTSQHVREGMTIAALAEAAQVTSDNTAANLLLAKLGGPPAFTKRLREIGDQQTRLDRTEPDLNLVVAGDERDTTTPRAMAQTLAKLLTGDVLKPASRDRLIEWMVQTRTGDRRIRAGLPKDWRAGDKTGTAQADSMTDKVNDIAIAFPPGRGALIVTVYYDSDKRSRDTRDEDQALLAEVGRLAASW
jgi:beta-lactamase class A